MSVDLAGSTAYKSKSAHVFSEGSSDPEWVKQIKHFYHDLPRNFRSRYKEKTESIDGLPYRTKYPKLWKSLGDEVILTSTILDKRHLALSVSAFVLAVQDYGSFLDGTNKSLDVKGSAWIAIFPTPNVTVRIAFKDDLSEGDVVSAGKPINDEFESKADDAPSEFDFLGRHIDIGFRIARHAASDEFIVSPELAYLLSEFCHEEQDLFQFIYLGKRVLKGVNDELPYPLFAIDVERSPSRRSLRTKERILTGQTRSEPLSIKEYLQEFMKDRGIDAPVLKKRYDDISEPIFPNSYLDYKIRWDNEAADTEKSIALQVEAETSATDVNEGDINEADDFLNSVVSEESPQSGQTS